MVCLTVCHSVHIFTCKCSLQWVVLVWHLAYDTINTGFSLGLLLILLLPSVCAMETLQLWISRICPFTRPNHLQVVGILGGPIQSSGSGLGSGCSGSSVWAFPYLHHQGELCRRQGPLSGSHTLGAGSPPPSFTIRASSTGLHRWGAEPLTWSNTTFLCSFPFTFLWYILLVLHFSSAFNSFSYSDLWGGLGVCQTHLGFATNLLQPLECWVMGMHYHNRGNFRVLICSYLKVNLTH